MIRAVLVCSSPTRCLSVKPTTAAGRNWARAKFENEDDRVRLFRRVSGVIDLIIKACGRATWLEFLCRIVNYIYYTL